MINAFFRPPAKRAAQEVVSRPASPPAELRSRIHEPWTLVDDRSSASIEASVPSLSDLDDVFDETPGHTPASSPAGTGHNTPGLPIYWALGSPEVPHAEPPPQLVMPTPLASVEHLRTSPGLTRASSPALSETTPVHLQPASRFSLRALVLPVGSAVAASCATLAYHAVGSLVAASYDLVPTAAVPMGLSFLAANYPMASLVGSAAGSLWGLHYLVRQGSVSTNVRANRASMCVSALATSVWLFAMAPAAMVGTAGGIILDLAQPAAQTYLLSALGLIYHADLLDWRAPPGEHTARPTLLMQPQDVEAFLALSDEKQQEATEPS